MLVRHTLLYLPAQIMGPVAQLLSILIWAHLLSAEDLGLVTLVISFQELAFAAFYMWWSHYALRYIAGFRDADARQTFLGTELVAIAGSSVAQSLILAPILLWYFPNYMTAAALGWTTLFMLTRSLASYVGERARSEARIALYTWAVTVGPVGGLLFGAGLILLWESSPTAVFVGFALAQALAAGAALLFLDIGKGGAGVSPGILKKAFAFGVPVMAAQMFALVALNAPRLVVESSMGLTAVGIFAVGYGLGMRASSFATMLVTAGAYPLLVRKMELEGQDAAYEQLRKNIVLVALVVMPVAVGLLAVNRPVVELFVAAPYRDATYAILPLATIGGLMRHLRYHTVDQVFLVRSRTSIVTFISIVDVGLAIVSTLVGIRFAGLAGAAAGPMIAGAATLIVSFVLSRALLGFRAPVLETGAIFLAAMVMYAAVWLLPEAQSALQLALVVAAGAAVYGVAATLLSPLARRTVLGLGRVGLRLVAGDRLRI